MQTLTDVLKNPYATELEQVLEQKANSPKLDRLYQPDKAFRFLQNNICASYIFARYTMPTYASQIFASLKNIGPVDNELGPIIAGVAEMVQGELYNNNVFERFGECHSHYFDMLEAFDYAGGAVNLVEEFMQLEKKIGFLEAVYQSELWSNGSANHAIATLEACEDPLVTFILVPATEELTPKVFERVLSNLCPDQRFDKFRTFLERHVELDQDDHGPITLRWLDYYIQKTNQTPKQVEEATVDALLTLNGGR